MYPLVDHNLNKITIAIHYSLQYILSIEFNSDNIHNSHTVKMSENKSFLNYDSINLCVPFYINWFFSLILNDTTHETIKNTWRNNGNFLRFSFFPIFFSSYKYFWLVEFG